MTKTNLMRWAILACFFAGNVFAVAQAVEVTLQWTNATELIDDSPIPDTGPLRVLRTEVGYHLCAESGTIDNLVWLWVDWPGNTGTVTIDVGGEYCFNAWHKNDNGQWSARSNEKRQTIVVVPAPEPGGEGPPKAPTELLIILE